MHEQAIQMETTTKATSTIKKSNRCNCCTKKLDLTASVCRCGFKFCTMHRLPEDHQCTYDYASTGKIALSTMMVAVVGNKLHDADTL
jgi:predicted nucleic acid binding AN1-type Zn finger protein